MTKLIIGLGNPGAKYTKTRHNLGWQVINKLQKTLPDFSNWQLNKKLEAEIASGQINHKKIILAKPQTFMNNSGRSVQKIAQYYKIKPAAIGIVYDDLDLPLGNIRIKNQGSAGGHKGVQSVIDYLKTDKFIHYRLGTQPAGGQKVPSEKLVLKKFGLLERTAVKKMIKEAVEKIRSDLSARE